MSATPSVDRPRWDGAVSAGLGAGFGYVLYRAGLDFWNRSWTERFEDVLAIALVGLGIVRFLEPLIGLLRRFLDLPEDRVHTPLPKQGRRLIEIAIFAILVLASVSHAFLHNEIKHNVASALGILLVALLIPGGITYAWLAGARKDPPRAMRNGFAAAVVLGALPLLVVWVVDALLKRVDPAAHPYLALAVVLNGLAWGVLGAAGGFVIDRLKGTRPAWSVAGVMVAVAAVLDLAALYDPAFLVYWPSDFAKIVGWGLGLMANPRANRLFMTSRRAAPAAQA
jgi:hypothetical protein